VVGQVIPWNFPLLMLAWKVAPALAMGNTVVLKPAEYTSLTALLFAEMCREVGLPPGVFNIVTRRPQTGAALTGPPGVDKIAFTGSTEVGRIMRKATAGSGKKLSLELGGKSPFIVFDDADLDSAVEGLVDAIWFNQGQVCCAGSRLLVQENVAEASSRKLKERMGHAARRRSAGQGHRHRRHRRPAQLERVTRLVRRGGRGGELFQPDMPAAARLVLPADAADQRRAGRHCSRRKRSSARCWCR
jgi:aldehyde dehydrogenase (NAD+)